MKRHLIVVAGGKGMRMGADVPKQFLPIGEKPILMRTLQAFYTYDPTLNIILVLPVEQQSYWSMLCTLYSFIVPHQLADGGDTRYDSVKSGLACVADDTDAVVAVHDGVRPFVAQEVIQRSFEAAEEGKAVIPVMDVVDTIRLCEGTSSRTVDRSNYKLVQTPQVFPLSLLKSAYQQPFSTSFTDDASVVEQLGVPIQLVQGNHENIKITTPFDLRIAESLLNV